MAKFNSKVRGTNFNTGDSNDNSTGDEIQVTSSIGEDETLKYEKRFNTAFKRFWQMADALLTQCRQISLTPVGNGDTSALKATLNRLNEYLGIMETSINQHRKASAIRKNF